MHRQITGWWDEKRRRRMEKKRERERRREEHMHNGGAEGRNFLLSWYVQSIASWLSFSMLSFPPHPLPSPLHSSSHQVSEVSIASGHSVVHFFSPFGKRVCVSVCVLRWIKGAELDGAWHMELMRHMMRQGEQRQLTIPPSSYITAPHQTHSRTHTTAPCHPTCTSSKTSLCLRDG